MTAPAVEDTLDALYALRQAARRELMVAGAGGDAADLDGAVDCFAAVESFAPVFLVWPDGVVRRLSSVREKIVLSIKGAAPPITETPAGREAAGQEKEKP